LPARPSPVAGQAPRYHRAVVRFLVLAFALLVLTMAVFAFALDTFGLIPSTREADFGFGRGELPAGAVLGTWGLEAMALIALYLLVQGRSHAWWMDGLATGWLAWVFRGPLLVVTVVGAARLPPDPWWAMTLRWLLLYSLCGLMVAAVASSLRLSR
jgi:hypothetical protein